MKTTDQTSERIIVTKSPDSRWYRVRPAFRLPLALCMVAWVGLLSNATARFIASREFFESAAQFFSRNGSATLDLLAVLSVAAVFVERARTTGGLRKLRRKLARSMRVAQSSHTARA